MSLSVFAPGGLASFAMVEVTSQQHARQVVHRIDILEAM